MATKDPWFWELRGDGEFSPPNIVSIGDGWTDWDGPLKSAPSLAAEIFVRELVQNFVDAAREHKRDTNSLEVPTLDFHFVELTGDDAKRAVQKLGIKNHGNRFSTMDEDERKSIRLGASKILNGNVDVVRFLIVTEGRTTGMYGPWEMSAEKITRKMRSAILSTVGDKTGKGLGAYGEGKRAVIAASIPRTMFIYTRFANREDCGDVNRRLLGVTYWRTHSEGNLEATGLALLGAPSSVDGRGMTSRPTPFTNEDADEFLTELGIPHFVPRDTGSDVDLGTTHAFLEPVFDASEICWSIERNWWPLMLEAGAKFRVFDYDGSELQIDPKKRVELVPFIECYESSKKDEAERDKDYESCEVVELQGMKNVPAGILALKADISESGWSWADRETNVNLVAIIRDGMIIEYEKFPRVVRTAPPYIRGIFTTDHQNYSEVAGQLRMVEPPLHNCFVEKGAGFDPEYMKTATKLYGYIIETVRVFRNRFKTTPPPNEDDYQDFGDAFNTPEVPKPRQQKVRKPKPPVPPPTRTKDPWTNEFVVADLKPASKSGDQIIAEASRSIALKSSWKDDQLAVQIHVGWQVMGDRGGWLAAPELSDLSGVVMPVGFTQDGADSWVGTLTKESVQVDWVSHAYDALWTVRPYLEISLVGE
jgi:hypothetical protein